MKTPKLLAIPFAQNGNKNTIYEERQASQELNEATYNTGFPPITMQPKEDGGLPPLGLDFNGIFFEESAHTVYLCMGGQYYFDTEYAEKINGYPKGAILLNDDNNKRYISNTDNNKVNFNTEEPEKLTAWSVIAISEIDKLLAGKIDNVDFSNALNLKADTSTKLTAGNGLSGGGDLTTSRTITLGTPSEIAEGSENTVTADSHTHKIAVASKTQKGIVKLSSTLSDSETDAATPKVVNDVDKKVKPIAEGGTGATTAAGARTNLGLKSAATLDKTDDFGTSASLVATQLLVDKLRSELIDATSEPVGKLHFIDDSVVPKGLIECAGQTIDRVKMPKLFAKYGEKMPNYRDRVARSANGPLGGVAGSTQEDAMQNVTGEFGRSLNGGNFRGPFFRAEDQILNGGSGAQLGFTNVKYDLSRAARTADETRVKSFFTLICTKIQ